MIHIENHDILVSLNQNRHLTDTGKYTMSEIFHLVHRLLPFKNPGAPFFCPLFFELLLLLLWSEWVVS